MLLKTGSRGEDVRRVQEILGIDADGIFGPKTLAAVKLFQREHGLKEDGIVGPITWDALLIQEDVDNVPPEKVEIASKPFRQPVDYKQYDSRWSKIPYTSTGSKTQTIGSSGCGPTACADVLATMVSDKITPVSVAQYFVSAGFRTPNQGTSWAAFPWAAKKYGLICKQTSSIETAKKYLEAGAYVVCSMGKGYWTTGGHYICAWKFDDKFMYANDPASAKRTWQEIGQFSKECKQYFCFLKE